MRTMRTNEVAIVLNKSTETIRRYVKEGILSAKHNGRDLLFDRDEVMKFAESRGIHAIESEVPQGTNFMEHQLFAQEIAQQVVMMLKREPEILSSQV